MIAKLLELCIDFTVMILFAFFLKETISIFKEYKDKP